MTTDEALSSIRKTLDSSLQANPEAWNVVHDELQRLQSELAQAQACCAEMRPFINGLFKVMCGEATLHGYDWPQIDKVLSSTCGTALLEELRSFKAKHGV